MKAIEFSARLKENKIEVPENFRKRLGKNQAMRVILLVAEEEEEPANKLWDKLTVEQFFSGYSDADSVYDKK